MVSAGEMAQLVNTTKSRDSFIKINDRENNEKAKTLTCRTKMFCASKNHKLELFSRAVTSSSRLKDLYSFPNM